MLFTECCDFATVVVDNAKSDEPVIFTRYIKYHGHHHQELLLIGEPNHRNMQTTDHLVTAPEKRHMNTTTET